MFLHKKIKDFNDETIIEDEKYVHQERAVCNCKLKRYKIGCLLFENEVGVVRYPASYSVLELATEQIQLLARIGSVQPTYYDHRWDQASIFVELVHCLRKLNF